MTKLVNIRVYNPNTTHKEMFEIVLPDHVTITGDEDHFALAYADAQMIVTGMREVLARIEDNAAIAPVPPPATRHKISIEGIIFK